jgi:hypothetical protein
VTADLSGLERRLEALAKSIGEITVQVNPTPISVAPAQLVAEVDLSKIESALWSLAEIAKTLKQEVVVSSPEVKVTTPAPEFHVIGVNPSPWRWAGYLALAVAHAILMKVIQ